MKRYLIFCLLLVNFVSLFARETTWHQGSVVLKTKEVLVGEIAVEPAYDLMLYRLDGKVDVYPAHKIHALYFHDAESNINRKFISLKESGLFNHHQLLEIVLRGDISIYRKQKLWTGNAPSDSDGFHYYVYHQERLIDLIRFRSDVYPQLMESYGNKLSVFIDQHKLNPNLPADVIEIVIFYNALEKRELFLAKQ